MLNNAKGLYAILDRVTGLFGAPFMQYNHATAKRYFQYLMEQSQMVASDCALYCVGEYDEQEGVIVPKTPAEFVCNYEKEVIKDGKKKSSK